MHSNTNNLPSPTAGFTMMELLLVLSLLVVLSGMAIVGIEGLQGSQTLDSSVENLRIEFTRTRMRAIDCGIPWTIRFDGNTFLRQQKGRAETNDVADQITLEPGIVGELIFAGSAPSQDIHFYPDGSVSGATIRLSNQDGASETMVLDRLTGMLQISRGGNDA